MPETSTHHSGRWWNE